MSFEEKQMKIGGFEINPSLTKIQSRNLDRLAAFPPPCWCQMTSAGEETDETAHYANTENVR